MAVTSVTIQREYPDGTNITVEGTTAEDVAVAFIDAYNRINYKPDPTPTPDPPV